MGSPREMVQDFIRSIAKNRSVAIDDSSDLVQLGIVDSVNVVNLVIFIEREFSVIIGPNDLIGDRFRTVNNIVSFILEKSEASR